MPERHRTHPPLHQAETLYSAAHIVYCDRICRGHDRQRSVRVYRE